MPIDPKTVKRVVDSTPNYCKPDGEVHLVYEEIIFTSPEPKTVTGEFSLFVNDKGKILCNNYGKSQEFIHEALNSMLYEALSLQDPNLDFEAGFCRPKEGHTAVFVWGKQGIGFGEVIFWVENGVLKVDNERMSINFLKDRFQQLMDDCSLQHDYTLRSKIQ